MTPFRRGDNYPDTGGLGYATPDQIYRSDMGGGACIVDKYPKPDQQSGEENLGQRQSTATEKASTSLN